MAEIFSLWVHGEPKPQGSKRHVGNGIMVEASAGLKMWRDTVTQYIAMFKRRTRFEGHVTVSLEFVTKRDADIDKLCRAILDALTQSGLILDDRMVTELHATKRKCQTTKEQPGVLIEVQEAGDGRARRLPDADAVER